MHGFIRSLGQAHAAANTASFTKDQNRAVLIAGLTCACFSVLATFVTLRWFILMKRTFRHKLVMFLILSDTFKALWYFIFPVVVFSRGPVASSSGLCQATGFFLAIGIEASDFAILMIALHSILYIFHPPASSGESGGLYRWRKFAYPAWIGLPILAASLAFVNDGNAYTTAGTYCYLPRRPFWYRLALSWIPRYFIITLIIVMYAALYIYVTLKFRSFSNLQDSESITTPYASSGRSSRRLSEDGIAPDEPDRPIERPRMSRSNHSYNNKENPQIALDPWDQVSFITSKPLQNASAGQPGVQAADFAWTSQDPRNQGVASGPSTPSSFRQHDAGSPSIWNGWNGSSSATMDSQYTGDTMTNTTGAGVQAQEKAEVGKKKTVLPRAYQAPPAKAKDPLRRTRQAIRKQLRYMFVYPAIYLVMWTIPFVSHCLQYSDYYVMHPVFGVSIVGTCMLSLQAGIDCIVFSWREKPWRRIPEGHKFSVDGLRASFAGHDRQSPNNSRNNSIAAGPDLEAGGSARARASRDPGSGHPSRATSAHWWEAEGKRRKDSVWLGTDSSQSGHRSSSSVGEDTLIPSPSAEDERALSVVHEDPRSEGEEGDRDISGVDRRASADQK